MQRNHHRHQCQNADGQVHEQAWPSGYTSTYVPKTPPPTAYPETHAAHAAHAAHAEQGAIGRRASALLSSLLPALCVQCEQICNPPSWLCASCTLAVARNHWSCPRCALPYTLAGAHCDCLTNLPPWRSATAPLLYQGAVRDLIARWKFEQQPELVKPLVTLAATQPAHALIHCRFDALVPIPCHWRRRLQRGFNQTELLASELKRRALLLPWAQAPIQRSLAVTQWRGAQHRLSRLLRAQDAEHRFKVRRSVANQRILLIDDVMTTGATLSAATQSLLDAGAAEVHTWCLARTAK